jgi:hypothetical protein
LERGGKYLDLEQLLALTQQGIVLSSKAGRHACLEERLLTTTMPVSVT